MLASEEGDGDEDNEGHEVVVIRAAPAGHADVRLDHQLRHNGVGSVGKAIGEDPRHVSHLEALVTEHVAHCPHYNECERQHRCQVQGPCLQEAAKKRELGGKWALWPKCFSIPEIAVRSCKYRQCPKHNYSFNVCRL